MYIHLTNGKNVTKEQCVSAMRNMLCEFGYKNITYSEVEQQVTKILNGQTHDLTIIGHLIKDYILPQK